MGDSFVSPTMNLLNQYALSPMMEWMVRCGPAITTFRWNVRGADRGDQEHDINENTGNGSLKGPREVLPQSSEGNRVA